MKTMFGLEDWLRADCRKAANASRAHSDDRVTSMSPQRIGGDVGGASDCEEVCTIVLNAIMVA